MLILYNPPSSASRKPIIPISLLALGALLEGEHEYVIVDGNVEEDPLRILDRLVREESADILGVTVMPGPQLNHAAPLCRKLKERHPRLRIIWGGYFPTQHFEACLGSGYVDFVVRGFGEHAFKELVGAIRSDGDPGRIPSVAFLHPTTGAIVPGSVAEVPDRDALPEYPHHRLRTETYVRPTFLGSRTVSHHSSYGCPFTCGFCAVTRMAGGRWRAQSGSHLVKSVRALVSRYRANAVEFHDNSFFIDEPRVAEFASGIRDLRLGWWAEARIDRLAHFSDATWELMRASGLRMVFMGAETGSEETLARMNKGGTASTELAPRIAEKMRRYGIIPEFSFVLGNPPDPEGDAARTIEFIRRLKRVNPASEIILYMYTPVPADGELFARACDEGFRFPETLDEWTSPDWREFSERREIDVPWLRPSLRRRVRDFEYVINAYYPTLTDPRLRGITRRLLRAASWWRYRFRFYRWPLELKVLQRLIAYQRPETSGL